MEEDTISKGIASILAIERLDGSVILSNRLPGFTVERSISARGMVAGRMPVFGLHLGNRMTAWRSPGGRPGGGRSEGGD